MLVERTVGRSLVLITAFTGFLPFSAVADRANPDVIPGWGEARDGIRVGLVALPHPEILHTGDILSFGLYARNVGEQPVEYTISSNDNIVFSLVAGNRLRMEGGTGAKTLLRLPPRQDVPIPGSSYHVRLVQPGVAPAANPPEDGAAPPIDLPLVPGDYFVECKNALWVVDKNDPNRFTALQARPGVLRFTFERSDRVNTSQASKAPAAASPGVTAPAITAPAVNPAGPNIAVSADGIAWGQVVDGLQGGIGTGTPLASVPIQLQNETPLVYYLRNTLKRTIEIEYPQFGENDLNPFVLDDKGNYHPVRVTMFDGAIARAKHTIPPGATMTLGHTRLKRAVQNPRLDQVVTPPTLVAPPGRYTVSLVDNVRFAGTGRLDIVLQSGALPLQIPPE